jgi:hypothetical protein
MTLPEPWMRGPIEGVHPLAAPVFYAFQQAREDLAKYTEGLSMEQIWASPHGFGSVGFHVLHIAGSTDRLMTYLQARQLSEAQLATLAAEETANHRRTASCDSFLEERAIVNFVVWLRSPLRSSAFPLRPLR